LVDQFVVNFLIANYNMKLAKNRGEDYCHSAMKLDYCKIRGLRHSFICQGTSPRRQRRELYGCGM